MNVTDFAFYEKINLKKNGYYIINIIKPELRFRRIFWTIVIQDFDDVDMLRVENS